MPYDACGQAYEPGGPVVGTVGRWRVITRGLAAVVALALALSGCWAQVGFGAEQQRHNPFERGITADNVAGLTERWAVDFAGSGVSEPMVSGGRVYVGNAGSNPRTYEAVALDAGSGEVAWRRNLMPATDGVAITNPLAFSGPDLWTSHLSAHGTTLVRLDPDDGAVLATEDAFVYGPVVTSGDVFAYVTVAPSFSERHLVVRDRATYATLWTREFTVADQLEFAMANGRVYVTNGPDLMAFDAAGCGAATCDPLWQVTLTEGQPLGNLAVGPGDRVVVTTPYHTVYDRHGFPIPVGSNVIARDGATGAPLWTASVTAVASGIAVTDEAVYVPTRQIPADAPGEPVRGSHGLTAFSLADGATLWAATTDATPAEPLSAGGVVYTGVGNTLLAYAAGGCGAATCPALATFPGAGSPRSIGGGRLYTTSTSGTGTVTLRAHAPG